MASCSGIESGQCSGIKSGQMLLPPPLFSDAYLQLFDWLKRMFYQNVVSVLFCISKLELVNVGFTSLKIAYTCYEIYLEIILLKSG